MTCELGIFCGTFNPIHWGHLVIAEIARDQLNLDYVLMITSPSPPHRRTDLLDAEKRFELVVAATRDNPKLFPSRLELERPGDSYTIDTINKIREDLKELDPRLNLIIGQDNLDYISQWHRATEIFQHTRLVVAPRQKLPNNNNTDYLLPSTLPSAVDTVWLDLPYIGISSSMIRQRIRQGQTILYLVPSGVHTILEKQGLYK